MGIVCRLPLRVRLSRKFLPLIRSGIPTTAVSLAEKAPRGQATVEYMLLLVTVIGILYMVVNRVVRPGIAYLSRGITAQFESQLFGADLHYFKIR